MFGAHWARSTLKNIQQKLKINTELLNSEVDQTLSLKLYMNFVQYPVLS